MKVSILSICLLVLLCSLADDGGKNKYVIRGTSDAKDGIAILNDYKNPDTVKIVNGQFEFKGTVDNPILISLTIPPSRNTRIIIEQGIITVAHTVKDGYRMGGTPNNIRFQQIEDALKPLNDKISTTWALYNKTEGEEHIRVWREYDQAKTEKMKKVKELVSADGSSFANFIEMVPVYTSESASNLKYYLELFKAFSDDHIYKYVSDHYKGAANTDIGVQPPDWTRPDPNGKMITLSSLKGKYVLIDFWYSGCHWCRKMTPHLKKIYSELKDKGFEIVSVSVDPVKDEDKWRKAMEEDGAPWLQAWDAQKLLPEQYGVNAYPIMFFLDKEGKVLQKIYGYHDEPILREFFTGHMNNTKTKIAFNEKKNVKE